MKNRKRVIFPLLVLLLSLLGCSADADVTAATGDEPAQTVRAYLTDRALDFSDVDITDGVLTITLNSEGEGYCTLEDVQAILTVYEIVHAVGAEDGVEGVQIYIQDGNGEQIYDSYEADVPAALEASEELIRTTLEPAEDVLSEARNVIVLSDIFDLEQVEEIEATGSPLLYGNCLDITVGLTENGAQAVTVDDCNRLYAELEEYARASGAIQQCAITIQDSAGNSVLYMGGDLEFGNCVMWISPEEKDAALDSVGPAPEEA